MKKYVVIISLLVILIVAGIAVFRGCSGTGDGGEIETSGEIPLTPAEKINIITDNNSSAYTRTYFNITFPMISGYNDESELTEEQLNAFNDFKTTINNTIRVSFNGYKNEISVVDDESIPVYNRYTYEVSYDRINYDKYVSLILNQNYHTSGMRSNEWKDTYVLDAVNFRIATLKDMCNFADYKKVIVDEVNRQAKANNQELVGGNDLQDIPDSQRFYINEDGILVIYFEPASIAPYLDGELEFKMPFDYIDGKFVK